MKNFYFPVSFSSDETAPKLKIAIEECHRIHNYTVNWINRYWLDNARVPSLKEFYPTLSRYLSEEEPLKYTQRYSLIRAVEQTFPFATSQIQIAARKKIVLAEPLEEYNTIQIQTRKVWQKYLALYGFITTTYGSIYPEGNWKEIVRNQAENVPVDVIPFLWHSVTVQKKKENWQMCFNLHQSGTPYGQKAQERFLEQYG